MKDALTPQQDTLPLESAAGTKDATEAFSAGVCPHCGGYLSSNKDLVSKDSQHEIDPECPTCTWKKFAASPGESTDRHGLV